MDPIRTPTDIQGQSKLVSSRLKKATETLHTFSKEAKKRQSQSGLAKMMSVFLDKALGRKEKRKHQEVLHAVEVINSERIALRSSVDDALLKAIEAYNECVPQTEALPKIAIPKKVLPVERHYPAKRIYQVTSSMLKPQKDLGLSKQTSEMFHMKVISLLERYGIASNPEARQAVKSAPISVALNNEGQLCALTQTIRLFPWQTITVEGASALDPITNTIRHLLPDSFSLSLVTLQTAFPHPMQRAGWSLSDQLLHESPQRPDLLPITGPIVEAKKKLQKQLQDDEGIMDTAKTIFKKKRLIFNKHAKEFVELHQTLAKTMVGSNKCEEFFRIAQIDNDPYGFIGETYDLVRETWMTRPYHYVLDNIANSEIKDLFHTAYKYAKATIQEKLKEAADEKTKAQWSWIKAFGMVLRPAIQKIMLQHLSEDFTFAPPHLTAFEKQLQASAYRHLIDFLKEMESGTINYDTMKQHLLDDIAVFQHPQESPISQELTNYFQQKP